MAIFKNQNSNYYNLIISHKLLSFAKTQSKAHLNKVASSMSIN